MADGLGNARVAKFNKNGKFVKSWGKKRRFTFRNSNPPNDIDRDGEIYKMRLDGTITGKFGRAGKMPKEFGTVNAIDCTTDNTLYVGEIGNLRVQKLVH